jgi:hypothetical protein
MNVSRPPVTKHVNNAISITTATNGSVADIDEDEYTALIYDSIIDDLLAKRRIANNSISLSSDSYYHEGGSVYSAFSSTDISMRKKDVATVKSIDAVVTRHNHSKGICNGVTSNKAGRNNKLRPAVHRKPSIASAATSCDSSSHVMSTSMIMSTSTDAYVDRLDDDASEMGQHYFHSIDRSQSTLSDMDNSISMRSARDIVNNSASLDGDGEISSSQAFYLEVERCTAEIRAKLQMIDDLDHLDSNNNINNNNNNNNNNNSLEDPTPPTVSELMSPAASLQSRDSLTYSIMHNNIDSTAVVIGHEMVATISSDSIPTLATSRTETVEAAVGTADDDDEDDDDGSSLLSGPSVSIARRNRSIEPVCLTEAASTNASATSSPSSLAYVEAEISILSAVAPVLPPKAMTPLPHWVQRMNSAEIYDNIADVDDSITMNSLINFKYAMADIGIKDLAQMTSSAADDDDDDRADGGVGEKMKEDVEYAQVMSSLMNDAMRAKGLSISGECRYHASISIR